MAEIALVVELQIKPGERERFLARARVHRTNVLNKEPGCLRFDLAVPREQDDTVYLYEVYADDAALETHFNTPYMKEYMDDTGPMIAQRTRNLCDVANE